MKQQLQLFELAPRTARTLTPGEEARRARVAAGIPRRSYRPSEFRWPAGPRPWVGEVARLGPLGEGEPAIGPAVEVLAARGSQRWIVRVDALGRRVRSPGLVSRGALVWEALPRYALALVGRRDVWDFLAEYHNHPDRLRPDRQGLVTIRSPRDWAFLAHTESERYLERMEEMAKLARMFAIDPGLVLGWASPDEVGFSFCAYRRAKDKGACPP